MKAQHPYGASARACFLALSATFAGAFLATSAAAQSGSITVTNSGADLTLAMPTTSPNYYALQTSADLVHWTNSALGVAGNGTLQSIIISNAISGRQGFYRYIVEHPVNLTLPQGYAFDILGVSCGGIQESISAGIDVSNGYPAGIVGLSTRCGGSGRDGGGHVTTYNASAWVIWDFSGNVISYQALTGGVTVDPTTPTDGLGEVVYSVGTGAYLVVPVPAAPVGVNASQSGDEFDLSWMPGIGNPTAITSSVLTATPNNTNLPVLTATITGPATSGAITTLQPQTTYQITVVNSTIGGTGPGSAPLFVTTAPATIPPSAPTGVTASWSNPDPSGSTDTLIAAWQPAVPGNSPVDQYKITITGSDGGGTFTQTVSGTTLSAYFTVDFTPNWSVKVQAHNAAGWGPVSSTANLGGL